ncbi:ferritin [Nocardia callitridis]|uniref:Ferritin BfrB n=1 Tax=Nocardia callitridis TaxID=648753 RepID=A0ABP9K0P9_9NOCA
MPDNAAAQPFTAALQTQIRRGFTAAHQYVCAAVYFDSKRLPRLAQHCYGRSNEQHARALRMVRHLLDRDDEVAVGGLGEIRSTFDSPRAAVAVLLADEQTRSEQISGVARVARDSGDYLGEQFIRWFLERQIEDVASLSTLLTVLDRSEGNLFDVEEFVARELPVPGTADNSGNTAPKMAGTARIQ